MNRKMVFNTTGRMLQLEGILLVLPLITALIYREWNDSLAFVAVACGCLILGTLIRLLFRPKDFIIYAKEGFVIVAAVWIVFSAAGAMPFVISGAIPNFVDAFFETVSGFTTTGASIINNVEALGHGILFWRSFTHWIGGMGILVFILAIVPNISDRSIHIMRAEMPGPVVDKIVPRARDTAKILYLIYIALTALELVLLLCGKMPFFDAVIHCFGTAGTGGFGIKSVSVGAYSSYIQWVIAIFMIIFGMNFNIFFLILIKRTKNAFKSNELWTYLGIVLVATALITTNVYYLYGGFAESLRHSFFQVSSIISTTGFSTYDFNKWPLFSKGILLTLMVTGACAGSTAGGLKVSRVVMLFKMIGREFKRLLHPRSISCVKMDGKKADEAVVSSVGVYLAIYVVCIVVIFIILCINSDFNVESNLSATLSCFNNIGPGLSLVGPLSSYAGYSALSKIVLSFAMLLGRLEIFPVLLAFMPSTWSKH